MSYRIFSLAANRHHEKDYVVGNFKIWLASKLLVNLVQWSLSSFDAELTSVASLTMEENNTARSKEVLLSTRK